MAPRYEPLISSLHDLANSKVANPVVIRGWAADILIAGSEDPIRKKLSHKIEADPKNRRCHNTTECHEWVKHGPNVYIEGRGQLVLAMAKDYEKTGKCNSALVQGESVFAYHLLWGVRWGDPRKELLNRGILRMQESGLIDWWDRRTAGSERCVKEEQRSLKSHLTRLTISNLQGPFAILIGGIILATFSWILEMVIFQNFHRP